ncbi:MAG: hypothetical protein AB1489_40555 [Acidobacteriota bacterium]
MAAKKKHADKALMIRLTEDQYEKLAAYCELNGMSFAEAAREWVRKLPEVRKNTGQQAITLRDS